MMQIQVYLKTDKGKEVFDLVKKASNIIGEDVMLKVLPYKVFVDFSRLNYIQERRSRKRKSPYTGRWSGRIGV